MTIIRNPVQTFPSIAFLLVAGAWAAAYNYYTVSRPDVCAMTFRAYQ